MNVFRPSEEVAGIVDAAVDRTNLWTLWTKLGIHGDAAARRAEEAGRAWPSCRTAVCGPSAAG